MKYLIKLKNGKLIEGNSFRIIIENARLIIYSYEEGKKYYTGTAYFLCDIESVNFENKNYIGE